MSSFTPVPISNAGGFIYLFTCAHSKKHNYNKLYDTYTKTFTYIQYILTHFDLHILTFT